MKRWGIGLVVVLLTCIPVFLSRNSSQALLADSDTKELVRVIAQERDPVQWLTSDWPLRNHFYRPVSTWLFELDYAVSGSNASGYGLTNVLLAIGCILALYWLARELTDSLPVATASAVIFALWHVGWTDALSIAALCMAGAATFAGVFRNGFALRRWWKAPLMWIFLAAAVLPMADIQRGVIDWLPGRTASAMALFALGSLATYARYERVSATRIPRVASPLDAPATRNTVASKAPPRAAWLWAVLAVFLLALALGSYEQGVMVPALLLCVAVTLRLQGMRVRWGWQAAFWSLLGIYLVVRSAVLPVGTSGYQMQAFRTGPGVAVDLLQYALPAAAGLPLFLSTLSVGAAVMLTPAFWTPVVSLASNLAAILGSARMWKQVLPPYLMGIIAFLPMAWLVRFEHYHYFPMAFQALFVVAFAIAAFDALATALSRPSLQAPPRRDPAPGSLPRP